MSDAAKYRPDGELDEKKKSDPLAITKARRIDDFGVSEEVFQAIHDDIEKEAQDAWQFAHDSPEPDPSTLYDYTYAPQEA